MKRSREHAARSLGTTTETRCSQRPGPLRQATAATEDQDVERRSSGPRRRRAPHGGRRGGSPSTPRVAAGDSRGTRELHERRGRQQHWIARRRPHQDDTTGMSTGSASDGATGGARQDNDLGLLGHAGWAGPNNGSQTRRTRRRRGHERGPHATRTRRPTGWPGQQRSRSPTVGAELELTDNNTHAATQDSDGSRSLLGHDRSTGLGPEVTATGPNGNAISGGGKPDGTRARRGGLRNGHRL